MKSTHSIFVILLPLLGANLAYGQASAIAKGGTALWNNANRAAFNSVVKDKILVTTPTKALNQLQLFNLTRSVLYKNPGYIFSPAFNNLRITLSHNGVTIPEPPAANASKQEIAAYRQQVDNILYQQGVLMGDLINKMPKPQILIKNLEADRYYLLEATRLALYQRPDFIFSSQFQEAIKHLKIKLPAAPAQDASMDELTAYRQQVDNALFEESLQLGEVFDKTPRVPTPIAQLNEETSQFIDNTRRAVNQVPSYIFSLEFKEAAAHLKTLGVELPAAPAQQSSQAKLNEYRKQVEELLASASRRFATDVSRPQGVRPLSTKPLAQRRFLDETPQALASLENATAPKLTWGKGDNLVEIEPAVYSTRIFSPTPVRKLKEFLTQPRANQSAASLYDAILADETFNPLQKQELISLLAEANISLSYNFIARYAAKWGRVPAVRTPSFDPSANGKGLAVYAATVQCNILKIVINEQAGAWTPEQQEKFLTVSAFLKQDLVQAEFQALSYLEPKATLWLVENGLKNEASQEILAQIKRVEQNALETGNFETRDLSPEAKTLMENYQKQMPQYLSSLKTRLEKLNTHWQELQKHYSATKSMGQHDAILPTHLLEIKANMARTQQMIRQIENRMEELTRQATTRTLGK